MSALTEHLTPTAYAAPKSVAPPAPSPTRADWKRRRDEASRRLAVGHPELEQELAKAREEAAAAEAEWRSKLVAAVEAENAIKAAKAGDEREAARASGELARDMPAELKEFYTRVCDRVAAIQRTGNVSDQGRDQLEAEIHVLFKIRDKVTYELAPSGVDGPELRAEISAMIRQVETAIAQASARDRRAA